MSRFSKGAALSAMLVLLTSCASIIEGSSDDINISTPSPMACSATNERGTWSGLAPGHLVVKKSRTDLKVNCNDQAGQTAGSTVISDVEPWVFGNILIGGIIGLGIDWITGAAYDYPENTNVTPTVAAPAVNYVPAPEPVIPPEPVGAPLEPAAVQQPAPGTTLYSYPPAGAPAAQPQQGTIAPLPFGGPTPAPAY